MGFFKRHRFALICAGLLLLALSLFSFHAGRPPRASLAGRLLLEVVGPVQSAVNWVGNYVDDIWSGYFYLVHAARQNEKLKSELGELRGELLELDETRLANERLRRLLDLKQHATDEVVAGEVVGVDPTNHFRTAIINRGTADKVEPLMPVVRDSGVVGRVVFSDEVAQHGLGDFKIRDDSVFHGTDGHDVARGAPQHHLGLLAHGQHLLARAGILAHRHHTGLAEHDALALDINQGVGSAQVYSHVI